MADPTRFCENRDGLICQGVNGFKSIVQGFAGDGGQTNTPLTASDSVAPQPTPPPPELATSAPDTASEATPPPPLPPPPPPEIVTSTSPPETVTVSVTPPAQEPSTSTFPQLILPTPVLLTSTSSRGSFIESLPTKTATTLNPVNNPLVPSIFASSDFNSPIGPATTVTSIPTETVIATPGATQGVSSDRSPQFPAALVAGVSGGVIAFICIFALLWRYYVRKQSQRRQAHNVADERGMIHTDDHHDRHDPFDRPGDRVVTTEIWTGSPPSKSNETRFSWAATEVSLGTDLEPLSPKPVIQQTVHRMSVPVPVEASSFRSSSKEGSVRGSVSRPPSTLQQTMPREASATHGTETARRSSTTLQVPGADRTSQQRDLPTQQEDMEEDRESDLVPAPLGKTEGEGPGLQRTYTLRSSPLHQNPFRDPVEEEEPTESPGSLTFEIVNADMSPQRSTSEPESEGQVDDRQEHSASPMYVLQTITLTAEDLKRASTARTLAG